VRTVALSFEPLQDLTQCHCNLGHAEQKTLKKERGMIFINFELGFDKVCAAA